MPLFKRKIIIAFAMTGFSVLLMGWRLSFYGFFGEESLLAHWTLVAGSMLLVLSAVVEGYYGGRLHHG